MRIAWMLMLVSAAGFGTAVWLAGDSGVSDQVPGIAPAVEHVARPPCPVPGPCPVPPPTPSPAPPHVDPPVLILEDDDTCRFEVMCWRIVVVVILALLLGCVAVTCFKRPGASSND